MRVRDGFVTNSSSSSFVLSLTDVTGEQLGKILYHLEYARQFLDGFAYCDEGDRWTVSVDIERRWVEGFTSQDNFDMRLFMERIGVDPGKARWSHS